MRALFLSAVANEERPRFETRLSMSLAEEVAVDGSRQADHLAPVGPLLTFVDDAASFPLNRPATTATDDTAPGDGFESTILLVCAVRNRRVSSSSSTSASDESDQFHRASTIVQILLFLPLTLVTLSANAFLLLSLLYLIHSLIHGSLLLFWGNPALPFLQTPTHIFLLLVSFNLLSQELSPWLTLAADWWGKVLRFSSPGFIIIECLSSLVVAQQLGRVGKNLVEEREGAQFGLLIASAMAYVASAVSIFWVSGSRFGQDLF